MYKFDCEKTTVSRVGVTMKGDVQEYALNLLKIINNVRDNSEMLTCYNDSGNNVYVICKEDATDAVVDWLGWFGDVHEPERLTGLQPVLLDHLLTEKEWDEDCVVLHAESPWSR